MNKVEMYSYMYFAIRSIAVFIDYSEFLYIKYSYFYWNCLLTHVYSTPWIGRYNFLLHTYL